MDYKSMKIEHIIDYCVEHNEVDWLKATMKKTYPTTDKVGNPTTRKITFIEVKGLFVEKYMPEIAPKKKAKKPTMFELVDAL